MLEKEHPSNKVKYHPQPELQTLVTVYTKLRGLILVESSRKLRYNHYCLAATGFHQVQTGNAFLILVENFSKNTVNLIEGQCIATD